MSYASVRDIFLLASALSRFLTCPYPQKWFRCPRKHKPHVMSNTEVYEKGFSHFISCALQFSYYNLSQPIHTFLINVKVKCTLVQALRFCTGRMARRGSRGIALPFHDHCTRRWGISVTPRPLFTPGKEPVPIVHEAEWAPGPVRKGAENLAPTGIRSPDRPARSQSLYRLSYLARHTFLLGLQQNCKDRQLLHVSGRIGPSSGSKIKCKERLHSILVLHVAELLEVMYRGYSWALRVIHSYIF